MHDDFVAKDPEIHRGAPAMTLAKAFIRASGDVGEEQRQLVLDAVMMAGTYIAEVGAPGQWEAFDGRPFFRRVDYLPRKDRVGLALALQGFFVWTTFHGILAPDAARRILVSIRDTFPDSEILTTLHARAEPALDAIMETLD